MGLIDVMSQRGAINWARTIWTKSGWELSNWTHACSQAFLHSEWKTNLLTIGALAGWQVGQVFGGSCSIFEDLGHVAVLNVVTKRFLGKVHGVVTAWTVQQWSQTQGNSHIFGTALSDCKDLLEAFGPVVLVNLPSQVARASGSGVSQPQQVLLWLCCYRGSWCKDTLVRCCRHSESAATPRLPHMKSQAIAWATNTRIKATNACWVHKSINRATFSMVVPPRQQVDSHARHKWHI